jgi:putative endonuclease
MRRAYSFYVYILTSHTKTVLYIGITNNLVRRIIEHKFGYGSIFTEKYKLKHLVYFEKYQYSSSAIGREKELKNWRREKKINLIKTTNPLLLDLSQNLFEDYGISNEDIKNYVVEARLGRSIDPSLRSG